MDKKLIIIRGIPGSGKTTLAHSLMDEYLKRGLTVGHYEADMHFMQDGVYKFNGAELPIAHKACFEKACFSMECNDITIVSNTFVVVEHMQNYIDYAFNHGVHVQVYKCTTNDAVDWKNVHSVPDSVLSSMKDSISKNPYDGEIIVLNGEINY